jgi:hypothetical protein
VLFRSDNEHLIDPAGVEQEALGVAYLINWSGGYANWKQTSYNRNFRKNYAVIGGIYDSQRDAFIPPKPFNSWMLNEMTCLWDAPLEPPNDGAEYVWNEANLAWELLIPSEG